MLGTIVALGFSIKIFSLDSFVGLLSGLFASCSQLIIHFLSKKNNSFDSNFAMYGIASALSLLLLFSTFNEGIALNVYAVFNFKMFFVLIVFAIINILNQALRSLAYSGVKQVASLAPFLYTSLIFSVVIDMVWLGIMPTLHVYIGVCMIIVGGALVSIHSKKPPL